MSTQLDISAFPPPPVVLPTAQWEPHCRRFSVDEYHRMIETGVLTENDRVQLIDGWIIEMPPIGPSHGTSTSLADDIIRQALPSGWYVRVQLPITLPTGEPEPDIVVARGQVRDYSKRHPGPNDIALVVEIADRTLRFDRQVKAKEYAAAQIAEYWIINLVDRQLEVHREIQATDSAAQYVSPQIVPESGSVDLNIDGKRIARLKVKDLFP